MESGKLYHLYTHANGFEDLFRCDDNYHYFLKRYDHFVSPVADTFAYCLMPNHVHFQVQIKTEPELIGFYKNQYPEKEQLDSTTLKGSKTLEEFVIRQFGHLFNSYTQAFNRMFGRRGSLFTHTFKRKEITDDSYQTNTICYIHGNPIYHGFVKNLSDWPWSSYQLILNDAPTFIKREQVLAWFGNRNEYEKIHQEAIKTKPDNDF
jgi:putative transposase